MLIISILRDPLQTKNIYSAKHLTEQTETHVIEKKFQHGLPKEPDRVSRHLTCSCEYLKHATNCGRYGPVAFAHFSLSPEVVTLMGKQLSCCSKTFLNFPSFNILTKLEKSEKSLLQTLQR